MDTAQAEQVADAVTKLRETIQLRKKQNEVSKLLIEKLLDACPTAKDLVPHVRKDGHADCRWSHNERNTS